MTHVTETDEQREARMRQRVRWYKDHTERGMTLTAIARRDGVHKTTVLRAIRFVEEHTNDRDEFRPPKPARAKKAERKTRAQINLHRWYTSGALTRSNVCTAKEFMDNPEKFRHRLPNRMFVTLHDILVAGVCVTDYETDHGWAERSSKSVTQLILDTIADDDSDVMPPNEEIAELHAEIDRLRDQLADVTGIKTEEHTQWVLMYGLTPREAQVFAVLWKRKGQVVTRDYIYTAVFCNGPDSDWPMPPIVDQIVMRLRRKLRGHPFEVAAVRGAGFCLRDSGQEETQGMSDGNAIQEPAF